MRDRVGKSLRLEEWARRDSFFHRRDARGKILSVLLFLVAVSSTPPASPTAFVPISALLACALWVSGLPIREMLARAAVIVPFPLFFGLVSWLENGNALFAATLVVRSYISALAVLLLMGVTPLPELLRGLRGLGVPAVLVMVLQSLVRYLQVVVDHALRMRRAALCRGAGAQPQGKGNRQSLWRRASGALAVLFGRSYARAEGVHRAMVARGFRGDFVSPRPANFTARDWYFLMFSGLAVLGARYLAQVAL
ncbi:MAG: energy-coupling factor transporter transmembrane component T family protein [Bryobacteraceae bacterium]